MGKTPYNNYTITGLKECTKYKFKIRAYQRHKINIYGKYSSTISAVTNINNIPRINKIKKKSADSTKVSWNLVNNADGYQIYMKAEGDAGYTKVKTIKNNKTTKYTKYNLKKGKKYYFKIRAYKIVDGKAGYSTYCKAKSIQL
jgi:fibronectin type 3 domain-containing protein